MRTWRIALGAVVLGGTVLFVGAPPAVAACHAFTIDASPASVPEGGSVTVTVERDAAVANSSIEVKSVDETAKAGSDYAAVNKKIEFTGSSTKQSFNVPTTNDAAVEASETFKLVMSDPGGCAVNPNFDFDDTATVTISDNDQIAPAPTTTAKPLASPTTKVGQTTTTTTTPESTTTTGESTTTTDGTLELATEDDGGSNAGVIALLAIGALGVAGAIGYLVYRRRAAGLA